MFQSKTTRPFLVFCAVVLLCAGYLMLTGFESDKTLQMSSEISLLLSQDDFDRRPACAYNHSRICSEIGEQKTGECTVISESAISKANIKVNFEHEAQGTSTVEPFSKILPLNASLNVMIEQFRVNKQYKNGSALYLISYDAFYPFLDGNFRGLCPEAVSDSCFGFDRAELSATQIEWLKSQGSKKIIAQALHAQSRPN